MTFQTEFPDFPADAMPTIPEGFTDRSWRNDACPCFIHEESGLVLWIDWPMADLRSWDGGRFLVERCLERDPEAGWQMGEMEQCFESDDWSTVLRSLPNFTGGAA